MFEIYTSIEIEATPKEVWKALTDTDRYSQWNPFIKRINGELKEGATIEVFIQPVGEKGMTFRPKVISCIPGQELRWLGKVFVPGLFDGEHGFEIEDLGEGKVKFIHKERFQGLLVPFLKSKLNNGTRKGFEAMNQALKSYVESDSNR